MSNEETAALADELDREYAEAWTPDTDDKIVGTVVDVSEREGNFGRYPIVTLRTEDGEERAVHAFHEVLSGELARIAPKPGETIGIKYLGKHPERGYHRYKVGRSGETADVKWGRYAGADATDVADASDLPADFAGLHAPLERDESDATVEAEREREVAAQDAAAADEPPF